MSKILSSYSSPIGSSEFMLHDSKYDLISMLLIGMMILVMHYIMYLEAMVLLDILYMQDILLLPMK